MVGADGPSEPIGQKSADVGALQHQHREARAVVDHQIATLEDIDDAALQTARMAALMLTLVLSAAGLSGVQPFWTLPVRLGSLGLGFTFCFGVLTHGSSNVYLGPGPGSIADVTARPYSEGEWLSQLLEWYAVWVTANGDVVYRHGLYLKVTQLVLLLSVALLGAGAIGLTDTEILLFG